MNCKYCFKDSEGRTWCLRLTAATFYTMRREIGELPPECSDPQKIIEGLLRLDVIGIVLTAILAKQLRDAGVTAEQLLESLYGEYLEAAQMALMESLADFFPNRTVRQALRQAIEQAASMADGVTSLTSGATQSGSMQASSA